MHTTLVTNATIFGNDNFWDEYKKNPCTKIGLSIKAFNENEFKCKTGTSSFHLTKLGIQRAISTKNCGTSFVFDGEDSDELIEMAKFAADCGAKSISISPSTPAFINGKPDESYVTDPLKFVAAIVKHYDELIKLFNDRISVSAKMPLCLWPREFVTNLLLKNQISTTCQLHYRSGLLFNTKGQIISCNSLHDFPLGMLDDDFCDAESLNAHISSKKVEQFYDKVFCYASTKCQSCSMRTNCAGGCPLFYAVHDGEQLIPGWD